MDGMPKWVVWAIVLVIVIAGGWYYMNQNQSAVIEGPVKVGMLAPLTGDAAAYGEPLSQVIQLAVEEINASGGLNGYPIELVIEDSKCDGTAAANATQKLINVDKVQVIIGGFCSSESLSAVPIAETAKVAMISGGSSSPKLTNVSDYFVRNYPSDSAQGSVLANIAYTDKAWKNVAFIQEQTDYAVGVYSAFNETFTELGGTTTNESFSSDVTDFRSMLTKLRDQNPDALFISVQTPAVAARILEQMGQLGWKPNLMAADVIPGDPTLVSSQATALEGTLTAEFTADSSNPKFASMVAAYEAKHGQLPYQGYASTMYDAAYLVRDAIAAVGYDGTKIARWLRTEVKDWDGAAGKTIIANDGDPVTGHRAEVIIGGKVVPYVK